MYPLRTFYLRCYSSIKSISTLTLQACRQQQRCLISPRTGCQVLILHGQNQCFHSAPRYASSQDKGGHQSPSQGGHQSPSQGGHQSPSQGGHQSPSQGGHQSPSQGGHQSPSQGGHQSPSQGDHQSQTSSATDAPVDDTDPLQDKSIGLVQRFKKTFRQYGKVMVTVHVLTSSVWLGTFYFAAVKGINVVPFLEFIGLPESIVNILKTSESGNVLTAYALYKIATPVRYTVTLGGTSISVKYLRKYGYLSTPPLVKDYIQDKMELTKERLSEKMEQKIESLKSYKKPKSL